MSLATPQTVVLNTVSKSLYRVETGKTASKYRTDDGALELTVSHQEQKSRTRHLARLDKTVVAADPLTSVNAYQKAGVYIVIDEPEYGFSDTDLEDQVQALTAWLSSANILAILASRH